MVDYNKPPTYPEIIKKANLMTGFTAALVICFWKITRLLYANQSDTERIGEILDLQVRDVSAEDLLTAENE